MKTVLKMNLSKYAPLSLDLQRAVIADQAVINDADTMDVEYIDNTPLVESTNTIDPEFLQKRSDDLKSCTTTDEVNQLMKQNKPTDPTILSLFTKRHEELSTNIQD
jgi:recombinational DNA repair protein RecT